MAGWIKLRHDLLDAPEIRGVARGTGLDCDQVLGKLARLWSWADRHGVDGLIKSAVLEDVDEQVGHVGFGTALVSVGWLASNAVGIVIPNWERHFSDSAKARALGANRAEKHRNAPSVTHPPDGVTQVALPDKTEKKTRGDEKLPPLPREGFAVDAWRALRKAWNAGPGKAWKMTNPPPPAVDRLAEPDWVEAYPAGIAKLATVGYFRTPVSLRQFCAMDATKGRFLDRLLGGEFDDKTATAGRGDFADAPRPPAVWSGPAELARRAMLDKTRKLKEESA